MARDKTDNGAVITELDTSASVVSLVGKGAPRRMIVVVVVVVASSGLSEAVSLLSTL